MDKIFYFQPCNLSRTLSTRYWKKSLRSAPTNKGRPKYLLDNAWVIIFSLVQTSTCLSTIIFGLKKYTRFCITYESGRSTTKIQNILQTSCIIFIRCIRISESSADSKCEIKGATRHTLTPIICPCSLACIKSLESPPAQSKRKYRL
jgi:hypothetical protein